MTGFTQTAINLLFARLERSEERSGIYEIVDTAL